MHMMRILPVVKSIASLSKDPSHKVGAVIIDEDGAILSTGFNGFPRGVYDNADRYADRETKLKFTSHAESNAIAQAARNGVRIKGATIVLSSLYPCSSCAKQIIQAGIFRVIAPVMDPAEANKQWFEEREISTIMFREAGVMIIEYEENT